MTTNSRSGGNSIEQVVNSILGSPWLWGTAVTFIFYSILPYITIAPQLAQRYFNANWVEAALTGLFFVGCCRLFGQLRKIPAERTALAMNLFAGQPTERDSDSVALAHKIETQLNITAKQEIDTLLVQRVRNACQFVINRKTAKGLEAHLKILIELTQDRKKQSYALTRTLIATIPVLGFLGTVIGVTMTLVGISNETLENSIADVTRPLAMSFDTTTLSLVFATLLVLGKLLIEQLDRETLDDIDDYTITQLPNLFPADTDGVASPFRVAQQQAAEQLLANSERMVIAQVELWRQSMEDLRNRWSSTLSNQQHSIDQMLKTGLTSALANHSQEIAVSRSEFMQAFRQTSETIGLLLAETRTALVEQQHQGCEQIAQTWQQFRTEITKTRDEHARQLALLTQAITAEVSGWQNQLGTSTQMMSHQFQELRAQGEVFLKLSDNESQLVRLEGRLVDNLESMRVVEVLENTMMSLNAAVNLLTSRVKLNAA